MASVPGSFVDERVKALRWRKVGEIEPAVPGQKPPRLYMADVHDGQLKVMVSQDPCQLDPICDWRWHLSISHLPRDGQRERCPTWDEMKHAKFHLVPADVVMNLVFPKRSTRGYLDLATSCLHLWECDESEAW